MKTINGDNMRNVEVTAYVAGLSMMGTYVGKFHGWGTDIIEYCDGPATSFTAAIVEKEDGTVEMVCPSQLRFIAA